MPLRFVRKSAEHDELITGTEVRREFGIHQAKLYRWVSQGLVRAYKTRFTKYTLYSKSDVIKAAQVAFSVAA